MIKSNISILQWRLATLFLTLNKMEVKEGDGN